MGENDLCGNFMDGVLMACDEVCGKRGVEVKEIHGGGMKRWQRQFQGRKMHTSLCVRTVLRRIRGGIKACIRNKENKAVSKAMRERRLKSRLLIKNCPNEMFRLVKGLKNYSKEVDGGRCMWGSDGKLCFSEKDRGKVWRYYMEWIMNEENDWDHNVEGDALEVPVVCVSREEVLQA